MKRPFIVQISLLTLVCAVLSFTSARVLGQAAAGGPKAADAKASPSWKATKTAWGDPDIQGIWSYATLTPLERTAALKGREFYTQEEAGARNAQSVGDQPPAPGDPGAYNAHWFDRGKVRGDLRTSLIVDPPDGRLPLSEEGRKLVAAKAEWRRLHPADSHLDRTNWD